MDNKEYKRNIFKRFHIARWQVQQKLTKKNKKFNPLLTLYKGYSKWIIESETTSGWNWKVI